MLAKLGQAAPQMHLARPSTMLRWQYLISTQRWPVQLSPRTAQSTAVQCLQTSATSKPELVQWVESHGGKVQGAALADLAGKDGGWGLTAEQDAEPGAQLIGLPAGCHLTYDGAADPRVLSLIEQVASELWGAKLALQMLAHRLAGPSSSFSTYITHLPVGVPGVPIFFGKDAIDALEYPPVSHQIKKRCTWLYEFSRQVLAKLPGTPADPFNGTMVDINALGWALAAVTSRAFRTRGPQYPAAMLPLIDMANHSFNANCEVLPTNTGVGLFAKRKVQAGEPLLLSYGQLSNDFLLLDYGFLIADNPYDTVQLRFDLGLLQAGGMVAGVSLAEDLSFSKWQHKKLAELRLEGEAANTEVTFGAGGAIDPRLLAAMRIVLCKDESEVQGRTVERLGQLDKPLNKLNEEAALRILSGVAAVALSRFTTTVEQDSELLSGNLSAPAAQLSDNMRLAIMFRLEKKKILSQAIQKLAQKLRFVLQSTDVKEQALASKKGQKPLAATSKGFGSKK